LHSLSPKHTCTNALQRTSIPIKCRMVRFSTLWLQTRDVLSTCCSELLSEPEEHLAIAPDGVLEAGLVAALFVLFAGKAGMAGLADMEAVAGRLGDQLRRIKTTQMTETDAGAAQQSGDGSGVSAATAGTAGDESRGAADGAGPAEGEGAAEGEAAGAEDPGEPLLPSVAAADVARLLPAAAVAALGDAMRQRLGRYQGAGIAEDEAALAVAEAEPSGEARCAKLAALTLVVAEKRILLAALEALGGAAEGQNGKRESRQAESWRCRKRSKRQ